LFIATLLHPLSADPNNPVAAFSEYAADRLWVGSHLGQFFGIGLLGVALLALADTIRDNRGEAWARLGAWGTAASVAATAALQAVDGVALKRMVDRWARASGEAQARVFESAFAVRQIEIGLASLTSILFGCSISALSIGVLRSGRFPAWFGWLGLIGGLGTALTGIVQAYCGFSPLAMSIGMPANSLLLLWALAAGTFLWRRGATA
jgi:Domain of unknown function (DUF4386)